MAGLFSICMINSNPCLERLERDVSTPPQQCHHWQRWLNLTCLAAPAPSRLEVDEPPEVTTQVTDVLRDASGWKPPQTIGFKDPFTWEGLRQCWQPSPAQPHQHFPLPVTAKLSFSLMTPECTSTWPGAAQGLFRICFSGVYLGGERVPSCFPPINALFYQHIHSTQTLSVHHGNFCLAFQCALASRV